MEMSKARIPIKGIMQKLVPKRESKKFFTKLDDPRAQILFDSSGMETYYL
jgi:hypothetical protein